MISPHPVSQAVAPKFTELNDLVSEKCGGTIIFATDDWFAGKIRSLPDPHKTTFVVTEMDSAGIKSRM